MLREDLKAGDQAGEVLREISELQAGVSTQSK